MGSEKIKILHIIPGFGRGGGVSRFLWKVVQKLDRERFQFDFLPQRFEYGAAIGDNHGHLMEEFLSLGCIIHKLPQMKCLIPHGSAIRAIMASGYDIIHTHFEFSGTIHWEAFRAGVPHRIVHVHNDPRHDLRNGRTLGRMLRRFQIALACQLGTHGFAVSKQVGEAYFGHNWGKDPRWETMYYGIDLSGFEARAKHNDLRADLGIPTEAFVLGNVGRLSVQKNQELTVDVLLRLVMRHKNVYLLLIGGGSLERYNFIRERGRRYGLEDRIILAGERMDVPELMLNVMDAYLYPSRWEGLGMALVEAQAAGLRCVVSDKIPVEATVIPELVTRLAIDNRPLESWVDAVEHILKEGAAPLKQSEAYAIVNESRFSQDIGIRQLCEFYSSLCRQRNASNR